MGKDEMKAAIAILSNKIRFKRAFLIIALVCFTLVAIAAIGFYTGAITWHGK